MLTPIKLAKLLLKSHQTPQTPKLIKATYTRMLNNNVALYIFAYHFKYLIKVIKISQILNYA